MDISAGKIISGIATTVIASGVLWIVKETHDHDISLSQIQWTQQDQKTTLADHGKAINQVITTIADPDQGMKVHLNSLTSGFATLSQTLTAVQAQRSLEAADNKKHWETVLQRLNRIDGGPHGDTAPP
jgi:hypothetical protein